MLLPLYTCSDKLNYYVASYHTSKKTRQITIFSSISNFSGILPVHFNVHCAVTRYALSAVHKFEAITLFSHPGDFFGCRELDWRNPKLIFIRNLLPLFRSLNNRRWQWVQLTSTDHYWPHRIGGVPNVFYFRDRFQWFRRVCHAESMTNGCFRSMNGTWYLAGAFAFHYEFYGPLDAEDTRKNIQCSIIFEVQ